MDRVKTARKIAENSLRIGSIKLDSENPFLWASGYFMPIYNDNRMNLGFPKHKKYIVSGILGLVKELSIDFDIIAGTSTAGIPWASSIQDKTHKPMIYVRDKPKDHGLGNQIEGIDSESDLGRKKVLLIEDLVSTGGSSVKAVSAIREANGIITNCISIFSYDFPLANSMFSGQSSFDSSKTKTLSSPCKLDSLLSYNSLIDAALELRYVKENQVDKLKEWIMDPFNWGIKHGFPPLNK